jgi:hypothetical protein
VSEYDVWEADCGLLIDGGRFLVKIGRVHYTERPMMISMFLPTYAYPQPILLSGFVLNNESMKLRCPAILVYRVLGYDLVVCQNIARSRKELELGAGTH